MSLRIIAFSVLICLSLTTLAWGNQLALSTEDTAKLSSDLSKNLNPTIAERRRSARRHIFVGGAISLLGSGLAIVNRTARRPDPNTTGIAIGVAVIGFAYGFYS